MWLPTLSEADPAVSVEGSIDPLGLYTLADALAVRLVPGVRERQKHPRFLTAMAVAFAVCDDFPPDTLAADEVSEPWQVFEWHQVQGQVLTAKHPDDLKGLPGQEKVRSALRDHVPLSAKRYLKTPTVFGFHGIYRALSRDVGLELADRLGEVGHELLTVWEREQGLSGLTGSGDGPGKPLRRKLRDAVSEGVVTGCVNRTKGWDGWEFFSKHLGIYSAGEREAAVITAALRDPDSGHRRTVFDALVGAGGQKLWQEEKSERRFHASLLPTAGDGLTELLRAIDVYERFSRLMQDAFDDVRFHLSHPQRRLAASEFATLPNVVRAAQGVPDLFQEVAERLAPFVLAAKFQDAFGTLAERCHHEEWVSKLLDHHFRVQASKPPNGKAAWFDRFDGGGYLVRTGYLRDAGGKGGDEYVHAYRTGSLWQFAQDLKQVPHG